MKNLLALIIFTVSTSAFAGEVEGIFGYSVDMQGITFQVMSGGCTKKQDFQVQQLETFPVQLQLVRNKVDACEAYFPYGITVKFTWNELGFENGTQFTVSNPMKIIRVSKAE